MSSLHPDSFDVSAIGQQPNSKKETCPAFSFGTGDRDVARMKLYTSKKHEKGKAVFNSPGPVYKVTSTLGTGPHFGFGQDEQRGQNRNRYPDSSVDLTCAIVDSQKVKFPGTPSVHFGTEERLSSKNAEIIRTNPDLVLGMESPGALEYTPKDDAILKVQPVYSFGPGADRPPAKPANRLGALPSSTPRHVGPGSHQTTNGLGNQPLSARPNPPSYSFGAGRSGKRRPNSARQTGPVLISDRNFSSLGKQVVSTMKDSTHAAFGRSTREQWARTAPCMTKTDRGPAGSMGKPHFAIDIPRTAPAPALRHTGL
mmetsp:Transcript_52130/g.93451  ORF Transcript_52130/g.93451 Transcript_52130/m.93451 type:complete len:312 (+) Transcript_52130:92-1027(+)